MYMQPEILASIPEHCENTSKISVFFDLNNF
jgi:hypothetical protein